jgi:hypothetical protein
MNWTRLRKIILSQATYTGLTNISLKWSHAWMISLCIWFMFSVIELKMKFKLPIFAVWISTTQRILLFSLYSVYSIHKLFSMMSWVILPPSNQNLVTVTTLNLQISWNWLENWHFETWQTEILDTKELAVCIVCRSLQLMWSRSVQDYLLKSHFAWKLFLVAAAVTSYLLNFSIRSYSSSSI